MFFSILFEFPAFNFFCGFDFFLQISNTFLQFLALSLEFLSFHSLHNLKSTIACFLVSASITLLIP